MSEWTGWEVYVDEERESWGLKEVPDDVYVIDFGCLPDAYHCPEEIAALGRFIKNRARKELRDRGKRTMGRLLL